MPEDPSEAAFERLCEQATFRVRRLRPSSTPGVRVPDFVVRASGQSFLAEVTNINLSERELEIIAKLKREKHWSGDAPYHIGERLRSKVGEKYDQLKSQARGRIPTLLVVTSSSVLHSCVEGADVWACMFGHIGVKTRVSYGPDDPAFEDTLVGGPGQKVTPTMNRSLGGIGILKDIDSMSPALIVYHNPFATLELPASALQVDGVTQFRKCGDPNELTLWERIP